MHNVIIVDDEPRIRGRIKRMIDWDQMGLSLVGEAQDGKEALDMAVSLKPEIMITDICLPYIDGLELVEELKIKLPECKVIIITGHDEFDFAYKAIKLKVFDFILKPIRKEQMLSVVSKAINELNETNTEDKYINWARCRIRNDLTTVRERLLNDWIKGYISNDEFNKQKDIFDLEMIENSILFVIYPIQIVEVEDIYKSRQKQSQSVAVQNTIEALLGKKEYKSIVFKDESENIVINTTFSGIKEVDELTKSIRDKVKNDLGYSLIIVYKIVEGGYMAIPIIYLELLNKIRKENNYTPIVKNIKEFIFKNYTDSSLTLDKTCDSLRISRTYAWKLLKKELGVTFRELLITVRINKAIELMQDPLLKLYEISEKVGFNSQHYFSLAFKKFIGKSPEEYRRSVR